MGNEQDFRRSGFSPTRTPDPAKNRRAVPGDTASHKARPTKTIRAEVCLHDFRRSGFSPTRTPDPAKSNEKTSGYPRGYRFA